METAQIIVYIAVMAVITYLIRMVPLVAVRKKLENRFLRSFLFYIPYAVLTAMTIPDIFSSTSNYVSAIVGLLVALILAYFGRGLVLVAVSACAAVFITEQIMLLI